MPWTEIAFEKWTRSKPTPLKIKMEEYQISIRNKLAYSLGAKEKGSEPTLFRHGIVWVMALLVQLCCLLGQKLGYSDPSGEVSIDTEVNSCRYNKRKYDPHPIPSALP